MHSECKRMRFVEDKKNGPTGPFFTFQTDIKSMKYREAHRFFAELPLR